jgi:hypothetical protein
MAEPASTDVHEGLSGEQSHDGLRVMLWRYPTNAVAGGWSAWSEAVPDLVDAQRAAGWEVVTVVPLDVDAAAMRDRALAEVKRLADAEQAIRLDRNRKERELASEREKTAALIDGIMDGAEGYPARIGEQPREALVTFRGITWRAAGATGDDAMTHLRQRIAESVGASLDAGESEPAADVDLLGALEAIWREASRVVLNDEDAQLRHQRIYGLAYGPLVKAGVLVADEPTVEPAPPPVEGEPEIDADGFDAAKDDPRRLVTMAAADRLHAGGGDGRPERVVYERGGSRAIFDNHGEVFVVNGEGGGGSKASVRLPQDLRREVARMWAVPVDREARIEKVYAELLRHAGFSFGGQPVELRRAATAAVDALSGVEGSGEAGDVDRAAYDRGYAAAMESPRVKAAFAAAGHSPILGAGVSSGLPDEPSRSVERVAELINDADLGSTPHDTALGGMVPWKALVERKTAMAIGHVAEVREAAGRVVAALAARSALPPKPSAAARRALLDTIRDAGSFTDALEAAYRVDALPERGDGEPATLTVTAHNAVGKPLEMTGPEVDRALADLRATRDDLRVCIDAIHEAHGKPEGGIVEAAKRLRWERDDAYKARDEVRGELRSLRRELATMLGPVKPREGVTKNALWIAKVGELLRQRDEARADAAQLREALQISGDSVDTLRTALNEARAVVERLEKHRKGLREDADRYCAEIKRLRAAVPLSTEVLRYPPDKLVDALAAYLLASNSSVGDPVEAWEGAGDRTRSSFRSEAKGSLIVLADYLDEHQPNAERFAAVLDGIVGEEECSRCKRPRSEHVPGPARPPHGDTPYCCNRFQPPSSLDGQDDGMRDEIDKFLAAVTASVGPDDHPLDNPEECAKAALATLRKVRALFSGEPKSEAAKVDALVDRLVDALFDEWDWEDEQRDRLPILLAEVVSASPHAVPSPAVGLSVGRAAPCAKCGKPACLAMPGGLCANCHQAAASISGPCGCDGCKTLAAVSEVTDTKEGDDV